MDGFSVTYAIATPESSAHGDYDDQGYIIERTNLRDAIDLVFQTRTNHCDGISAIEANEYPVYLPQWISVYNGMEYLTGASETRAIHFPKNLTSSTRIRIARLMGCYSVN